MHLLAEIIVKTLQRFDEQIVERKPDGSAPIGIAAELPGLRFGRRVAHRLVHMIEFEHEWVREVCAG